MYTIDEFRARISDGKRRLILPSVCFIVLFFGLLFFNLLLEKRLKLEYPDYSWLSMACIVAVLVMGIGCAFWLKSVVDRTLPRCPHCQRVLRETRAEIVIASGNCPCCGKPVIEQCS